MTEKEKAKAYDEAIERVKKSYGNIIAEEILPELKEGEDEKIRKEIISILRNAYWTSNKNRFNELVAWLEQQCEKSSWKPSKEEMDALYSLSYITNEYDEYKEDVITHLYQDLKREFFNDSSYENMFLLDNKEDDVRRRSTIQVLEYARSLDTYNQYGKADIDKNIAWLKKQGEQASSQTNERAWLYLVSDVLTWNDGIGQYLDDPRVQELAKRLCSKYSQKLYNPSKFALENQWISVENDLPCNHEALLNPDDKRDTSYVVAVLHGHIVLSRMYKLNGKWYWENDEPTHWLPIPKLPK